MSEEEKKPLIQTPSLFGNDNNILLERALGQGGMGGVYLGRDKMLDRPVAVKVMLPEYGKDPAFVEKFKREAQAVAKLLHPNIAQVYSFGIFKEMPYIAMELVTGTSLDKMIENAPGRTEVQRVIKITQQIAQALQCAADRGIIHGDVKPENVLLDADGQAKLVDFGLAAMQHDTTEIWGTPYYISPEKVKKEEVDFRADMYSLGGTLYHALTGKPPFDGADTTAVVKARFTETPKKPSELRPDLTPAVDNLVMTMLAFNKEDRYPSWEAFLEQIKEVLKSGLGTTQKTPTVMLDAASTAVAAAQAAGTKKTLVPGKTTTHATLTPGKRLVMKKPGGKTLEKVEITPEEDEEEGGGKSVGLKIAAVVGGIVLAVAVVGGGLFWYVAHDKAAKAAEHQSALDHAITVAREGIEQSRTVATKDSKEFVEFSKKAMEGVEKNAKELKAILPEYASMMTFEKTKELKDAEAMREKYEKGEEAAPAKESAPASAPSGDSASTTGADKTPAKAAAPAPAAPAAAPAEKPKEVPQAVLDLQDLWERACSCQASTIRVVIGYDKVIKMCGEADQITGNDEQTKLKLEELSRQIVEEAGKVRASKDVENVRKGIGYINSKGGKSIAQAKERLRLEKLEAGRKAKKEAEEAAKKAREEKAKAEHDAKVTEEVSGATAKFDALVAGGTFRLMDWKSAERILTQFGDACTTAEGDRAVKTQLRKVEDMALVQTTLIKNMKDYVFTKGIAANKETRTVSLKGAVVTAISDKEIALKLKDGTTRKLTWVKFYHDYCGNFNEVIIQYIENGRENCKPHLGKLAWSRAMLGTALTLKIICSDVNGAVDRSIAIAQKAVQVYPECAKEAKAMFPDMDFKAAEED